MVILRRIGEALLRVQVKRTQERCLELDVAQASQPADINGVIVMNRERAEQVTLLLLRVVAGVLFTMHGGQILFGWFGGPPGGHPMSLMSQMGIGGMIEFAGGILLILGLWTRIAAFIVSGTMAVAYFQFHQPMGWNPLQNHGEPAILFCFLFLYLVVRGAGEYSMDGMLAKRRVENRFPTGRPAIQS